MCSMSGEARAAGRGCELWLAVRRCVLECSEHTFEVEICSVDGGCWLLAPGLIQPAYVNRIESEFVHKLEEWSAPAALCHESPAAGATLRVRVRQNAGSTAERRAEGTRAEITDAVPILARPRMGYCRSRRRRGIDGSTAVGEDATWI